MGDKRIAFQTHGFAVVVCRHPVSGKFLAVSESRGRGWWLPAGHVDYGQTFVEAALRETQEEAGVDVTLKGVLAVEHSLTSPETARMRVIFYAEPTDIHQAPKSKPDRESEGAEWLSIPEIEAKRGLPLPHGLRGEELLRWGVYVAGGGVIGPLTVSRSGRYEGIFRLNDPGPVYVGTAAEAVERGLSSPSHMQQSGIDTANLDRHEGAKQWTPLHRAVADGAEERVRSLLLAGAKPDGRTHKGRTALHFAVSRNNDVIVRLLLLAGADPCAADSEGRTPADIADSVGDDKVLRLIQLSRE
ncbi:hypothetical protein KIPB_007234 [Kipferlia bialata]|uniref:Nudix hydrolase domain-containing protein n=1 Tax=Kipferlia bialata TaxID=797122 RepID=A0A9K3CVK8_9EUKA|nr:hypothetical protein KIPB_003529 [Kipferlia bialata]GIQ82744.1 hypothetical protein KIPB_003937 [Kipferlia bialata]GIQ83342.1 hypothetical protein KIPB_004647 [Kipferlia bialata]GIQ85547.1 hypothetical protein KIPB_007234 [Kipferlia bialata]|eukprot:g3529.t1